MSKLLLLFLTIIVGSVFLFLPKTTAPYDYFLFSDMELYFATYVYFISERFIMIILVYIIANEATEYRSIIWVFFWLLCADMIDFLLSYNGVWFKAGSVPITMNICKVIVFGFLILNEWSRRFR